MHQEKVKQQERRAIKFENLLKRNVLPKTIPLNLEFFHSKDPVPFSKRLKGKYKPIKEGQKWGEEWESAWFHVQGKVPNEWKGTDIALHISFGGESLIFDDSGCPIYALTDGSIFDESFQKDVYRMLKKCKGGEKIDLYIEAAGNGLFGIKKHGDPKPDDKKIHGHWNGVVSQAKLCVIDEPVWNLWLDLKVINGLYENLPEKSVRKAKILKLIINAVNAYGDSRENLENAKVFIDKIFANPANASDLNVIAVGHAHIDTGWLWPVRETIRKCGRTFSSQVAMLEKYPDYVFGASQAAHYQFTKEHYPALYKKIKKYIKEGRWEIQGGTWVEHDCNLISGESMVRQFVHGKNFYKDEFDFEVKNLWIPDVFGYSASMPQILKKSGVDFFLTQKMSWNQYNKFPHHTFKWRGIDGTEIVTHFPPQNTYNSRLNPKELRFGQDNFIEKDIFDEFMSLFGMGDGGGGPSEEFIEHGIRAKNIEGLPKVKFGRSDKFFERVLKKEAELDTWEGELYLELHRGTYTTQARTKKGNRMLENKLRQVEFLCSNLPAKQYPKKELDKIWKNMLMNQFHDIIPGSSIHKVYEVAEAEYAENLAECARIEQEAGKKLFNSEKDTLTLVNCLSNEYTQSIELPESWQGCGAVDSAGNPLPCQQENEKTVVSVSIPANKSVTIKKSGKAEKAKKEKGLILENDLIRYEFANNGEIVSVKDKETGHLVLDENQHGNVFSLYNDNPINWDAWDIDIYYEEQFIENAQSIKAKSIASGDVRKGLEFELSIGKSQINQKVYLDANSKRLDFVTEVDWKEMHRMLRVAFPVRIRNSQFTSDIQYGYAQRQTHRNTSWDMAKFETAAHRYVDLSDPNYGVALLNDCKYGHKVYENIIDLNLLRAPTSPDPVADQGHHEFVYSLLPHEGSLIESDVMIQAAMLNTKPVHFENLSNSKELCPIKLDSEGISLEAVKRAEKDDSLIIRLVETKGCYSTGTMELMDKKAKLTETDLIEWNDGKVIPSKNPIKLKLKPFEIRTYRIK